MDQFRTRTELDRIRVKHRLPHSTLGEMQAEVSAFVSAGMDVDEACQLVGLPRRLYRIGAAGNERITHLPTPAEIEALTIRIRAGERICTRRSQERWLKYNEMIEAGDPDCESFDLAGQIAEDACTLPPWLYSADEEKETRSRGR
ncbi:hypothetical protein Enr13x_12630 [Stieleria neptunia]|uniref:Uncharacterized protein n=1 Tax=Stieleria neptunia TaxID=2527979 RepID=A0A518HKP9_9BACT|nr:hypothetical protein [Stieleria neptunia]QDV41424.1 hypothetical protein Enr13x_12630 [Stieleria neptunia]